MVNYEEQVKTKFKRLRNMTEAVEQGFPTVLVICNDYNHVKDVMKKYQGLYGVEVSLHNSIARFGDKKVVVLSQHRLEAALGYDRHTTALLDWGYLP